MGSVVVASGLVAVTPAVASSPPASQSPPISVPVVESYERPDLVSARLLARSSGRRVEVTGLRSESVTSWVNPDGTQTDEVSSGPVRVRRGDGWVPVDTTLVTGGGRVRPRAVTGDVSFSAGGDGDLARLTTPAGPVGLSWAGSLPAPVVAGSAATYRDVLPGVDLVVAAVPKGFEQSFVLRERPTTPPVLRLGLEAGGLESRRLVSGAIEVVDAAGAVVASVGAARMWDATTDAVTQEPRRVAAVASSVSPAGVLELRPDAAFLADPTVVFPVVVDPTVILGRSRDTYVQQNAATTNFDTATQLRTGLASVGNVTRAYIGFDVSAYASKVITGATLKMTNSYSPTCTSGAIHLYKVTSSWNSATMTYGAGQPTIQSSPSIASASGAYGGPTCSGWGWYEWSSTDLTSLVAGWADGSVANHGLRLTGNDSDLTRYRVFVSGEGTAGNQPKLEVTYNSYPSTTQWPVPSSTSSVAPSWVTTTRPTLSTIVRDVDGGNVSARFYVDRADTGAQVLFSAAGGTVTSGARSYYTVGSGSALTDGLTYRMRSKAYDGSLLSQNYSGYSYFTVDATKPVSPTVTSSTHPAGQWSGTHGGNASFSFSPGTSTDVVGYLYRLADDPVAKYTTASSVTFPVSEGPHTLRVRAVDRAGNQSDAVLYDFKVGQVAVTSPDTVDRSEAWFTLSAETTSAATALTWRWRRSDNDSWADVTGLTTTSGTPIAQPLTVSSGVVPPVRWNAAVEEVNNAPLADGPLQLSAVVTTSSGTTASAAREVTLDRANFGSVTATADIGPASVNLRTGNAALAATDVSIEAFGSDLTVSRSFNSRAAGADADGPFGPGWVSAVPVEAAESAYTGLTVAGNLVTVTAADGDSVGFTKKTDGTLVAEHGFHDATLTYVAADDRYDLKDLDGNVTGFTVPAGGTGYVPTSVARAGDASATRYAYATIDVDPDPNVFRNVTRVTAVLAPSPTGVTCTLTSRNVRGCRSLDLTYAAASTTPPGTGQTGDYPHRLKTVSFTGWDPDAGAMTTVNVAAYSYHPDGRLAQAWDARLPALKTSYGYDSAGHITSITPPGEEAWTLTYAAVGSDPDTGRLRSVSRPTLTTPSTATTTVVYGVPVSGTGAAPYDLSSGQLDRTGQVDRPADATAVFPPTTTATFASNPNTLPSSYDRATVHYLNADGREVNTADGNGGITTTEYDNHGHVLRTLSAANRQRAFDRSSTDSAGDEAAIAATLSTTNVYAASGTQLLETYGPEHEVTLGDGTVVRARTHTVNTYDEGAPAGGPFHRVTTSTTGVRVPGESTDRDTRTTTTAYGPTATAWLLGQPTAVTIDPAGLALTTRTSYTGDGRVLTQTLPAGGTSITTPATRITRYYTAGTHADDATCGNRPEWVDLVCASGPGGQPATGPALPTTYATYDLFNQPRVVTEKDGSTTLRTTTTVYDSAGRSWKTSVTATTGTALPTAETVYDTGSGRATKTRTLDGSGTVTAEVVRVYNTLGQLTSYTDSDGNASTTTYDVAGRPLVTSDGKGTQTRTYDGGTERRGLVTSLADSHAGTWTATYDTDGTPTVDWPNGLRSTTTVDETGSATALTYAATSGCTGDACVVLTETVGESAHGHWLTRTSTLSAQTYGYDVAGRLTQVADTPAGAGCTTRRYTFDNGTAGNSNRTKLETFDPGADGACHTTTAASTVNSTFDTADRITTAGTVYDALGRTTTVPDADALDGGDVTVGYHANDLVRSISRTGGATHTYTLDVDQQRIRSWTDGTTTRTHHFDSDSDSPSWIAEGATAWTRNIGGISGSLAAIHHSTIGTTLQFANLHGDIVATAPTTSTTLASTFESTEYGAPRGDTGIRYAWLGGKQRAADTPTGLAIMGARLYNPATGRFLQLDPIYGGNRNAYVYVVNPLNEFDLDGRHACWRSWGCLRERAYRTARWVYRRTEVSMGGCFGACFGVGFQGGTGYGQIGAGCCWGGVNIGFARKEYRKRNCSSYTATGKFGPAGGYGSFGRRRGGRVDWGDFSGGYSAGEGAGGGWIRNIDLGGQKRYCR